MNVTIYHNAKCSKSRATLSLLQERGIEPTIIHYLETPPSVALLRELFVQLGKTPAEVIRFGEDVAQELGIKPGDARTVDEWAGLMVANPILIERPIVVVGERAAIGRPPENVMALLD